MMGAVAIIALLIVLNAVYVAAEFAIVAARRQAVEERAASGDAWAGRVLRIMRDQKLQDRYIATAQLGITLASLGLGMYGERALSSWIAASAPGAGLPVWLASHAVAGAIAIIVLTYFHIVLGEMIPKAIALADADRAVCGCRR
jgi:CBS domain containing-hemolysin-like protein